MRTDYILENLNKFKDQILCTIYCGRLKNNYKIHGYQARLLQGSMDYVEPYLVLLWEP